MPLACLRPFRWIIATLLFAALGLAGAARAEDVVYMGWSQTEVGLRPTLEKLLSDFQARNPGDKLQVIGLPFAQIEQNLILRRRNDQRVDVAQLQERWLPEFVKMGALYDLNAVIGKDALAAAFDPDMLKLGQLDGKQYGIPFTAGTVTLVANRNVLKAAGITEPPKTVDEFTAALRKIKAWNKDVIPFGMSTKTAAIIEVEAMVMFWAQGAHFIDDSGKVVVDSPQGRAALKYLADLVKEGLIAKGNDRFDTRKLYSADKVAFFIEVPVLRGFVRAQAGGPSADGKIQVLPMLTAKAGDTPRGMLWAHYLVMFNQGGAKGAPNGAGAKLLRAVGMDASAQTTLWNEAGQIPTLKATVSEAIKDPYAEAFVTSARTAQWDETARFANGAEMRQIIGEEVEAGMLGAKSVDDAIASMARRLNAAVKESR